MSANLSLLDFGTRLELVFEIDALPGVYSDHREEDGSAPTHGYLAHVVGTDDLEAVDFSAEELGRGTRVSPSSRVGCEVGERVCLQIEIREPTLANGDEFRVVVVGVARPTPNTMLADEIRLGRMVAA